jgi:hypothetical protein
MIRQNYFITEQQKALLLRLKRQTGLPISEIVRRAIDHYTRFVADQLDESGEIGQGSKRGDRG